MVRFTKNVCVVQLSKDRFWFWWKDCTRFAVHCLDVFQLNSPHLLDSRFSAWHGEISEVEAIAIRLML